MVGNYSNKNAKKYSKRKMAVYWTNKNDAKSLMPRNLVRVADDSFFDIFGGLQKFTILHRKLWSWLFFTCFTPIRFQLSCTFPISLIVHCNGFEDYVKLESAAQMQLFFILFHIRTQPSSPVLANIVPVTFQDVRQTVQLWSGNFATIWISYLGKPACSLKIRTII